MLQNKEMSKIMRNILNKINKMYVIYQNMSETVLLIITKLGFLVLDVDHFNIG